MLRDLPRPLSATGLRKWLMRTLAMSETETREACLPLDSLPVSDWNDFAESLVNIENLEQPKAEVKKRHFLISLFSFPNKFHIGSKVDNYAFSIKL